MPLGETPLFTWLHVSDLHFGHGDVAHGWNQETVLASLRDDVRNAVRRWPELPHPDAVLITGDIAYSGAVRSQDEYERAGDWIRSLLGDLGISDTSRVYMVPGNHDVQRNIAQEQIASLRRTPTGLDATLATAPQREALYARQGNYYRFALQFNDRPLDAWSAHVPLPQLGSLSIVGLNTALLCVDDADRGKLHLTEMQRHVLSTAVAPYRLLLTHHPFEDGWLHDESTLRSLAREKATIHACGHTHSPRSEMISASGGTSHVRLVAAAAHREREASSAERDSHGYNFSSLILDARGQLCLRTWPRRWMPQWAGFRVDHMGVNDRRFFDEKVLSQTKLGSGLVFDAAHQTKLLGVHWWGHPVVRWDELLRSAKEVDVFGVSMRTLFEDANLDHVRRLLAQGGRMRVVLGDPRDKRLMAQYDRDFELPLGDRTRKVVDVLRALLELESKGASKPALEVYVTRRTFKYSAYRIDGDVLFVPYRMVPGRRTADTPALAFPASSTFVQRYVEDDINGLLRDSQRVECTTIAGMISEAL